MSMPMPMSMFMSGAPVLPASLPTPPSGTDVPPGREVPHFPPVRVRGGREGLRRLLRHRRRAVAAGLAVTAVALVAAGARAPSEPQRDGRARGHPASPASPMGPVSPMGPMGPVSPMGPVADDRPGRVDEQRRARRVTAPVRIADAATVRLLRPGDRVDVIAAEETATGGEVRVVARGAVVSKVPGGSSADPGAIEGTLLLLSVPRGDAAELAGASATARLAVTLW
ncbi:hypothetical protein [Streptomyces flavalbus]|uniref:Flp pilus assembly protein RcpC/CpaB domain-containing protein n=1 Tax=Streptomyces flavalbus TaxID=2665155 RepID=A0ABW2WD24_9ACTN